MQRNIYLPALVVLLPCAVSARAATVRVPDEQPTIQAGINAAGDGDTVLVAAGTYAETITFAGKAIAVISSQGAAYTVLDGAGTANPVVALWSGEMRSAILEGFTIRNAARAIRCIGSSPAIRRNTILNNSSSQFGAGLYTTGGAPLVEQNTFQGNSSGSDGGAVTIDGGACVLIGNSFVGNHAGNHGGAVYSIGGHTVCKFNVFIHNSCGALGGAYLATSWANDSVVNNTMVSNSSRDGTLALWASTNDVALNNIIAYNAGPGVIQASCGNFQFAYNDVYGNSGAAYDGMGPGAGDLAADPLFADTTKGDFHLVVGSPCIDAGVPDPRFNDPDGTRSDMGAIPPFQDYPIAEHLNLGPDNANRVIDHTPAFFWSFLDITRSQVGLELEVGVDTLWDTSEMWFSGQILSSDTSIAYAGSLLADGSTYCWRVRVNDGVKWGGWRSSSFYMNSKPSMPVLNRPVDGAPVCLGRLQLFVDNSTDPESDPLAYDFQIFSDSTLTTLVASQSGIRQTPSPTGSDIFTTLLSDGDHWWRSRASDGYEHSEWSSAQRFSVSPRVIRVPADASTIAQAVDEACDEDTILIAHGRYLEGINPLGRAIVVAGTLPVESTIVTNAPGTPVVTVANGEGPQTIIRDLTITGAQGATGVAITASSPEILDNLISSNFNFGHGGGVWIHSGSPVLRGNRFIGNSSSGDGGGVFVDGGASAVVDSNIFLLNSADAGTAVAKTGTGGLIVSRNIMYANSSSGFWGGTIYTKRQVSDITFIQIDHNTIVGNTAMFGKSAGIVSNHPQGGGISNNIVAFNEDGYGLFIVSDSGIPPQVSYNDVWWSDSGAYFGVTPATGNIAENPQLCDTSQQDFHLASTSPCLGTGASGADIGALDQGCVAEVPLQPNAPQVTIDFPNRRDHVVNHTPAITWRYVDPGTRPFQGSEIQVGTDQGWGSIEMWQPPFIPAPDTSIQYGGMPLVNGATCYMRIRVRNDVLWSDWSEISFHMNSLPTIPGLLSPAQGAILHTGRAILSVSSATDADGDPIIYSFEVYTDSNLTHLAGDSTLVGSTAWTTDSLTSENARHWWRVQACDGFECSPWSSFRSFWVNAYDEPPTSLLLRTPLASVAVYDPRPTFAWDPVVDPDPGSQYIYTLTVSPGPSFTSKQDLTTYLATSCRWPETLLPDATYWWRVHADDLHGDTITSAVRFFWLTTAGDENGDGVADVSDVIWLIDYIFAGGLPPSPPSLADVNGDCVADVFDIIYLINHIFSGGPTPVPACI